MMGLPDSAPAFVSAYVHDLSHKHIHVGVYVCVFGCATICLCAYKHTVHHQMAKVAFMLNDEFILFAALCHKLFASMLYDYVFMYACMYVCVYFGWKL